MRHSVGMSKSLSWLMITVLVGSASGCDAIEEERVCTAIGCGSSLDITLAPESNVLSDGTYLITVDRDGDEIACSFRIPDDISESGEVGYIECAGNASEVQALLQPRAGANNVIVELHIAGAPQQLGIEVTRDAQSILSRQLQPSYTQSNPNGPECPPTCPHADLSLTLAE